jgi:hypothetical protein
MPNSTTPDPHPVLRGRKAEQAPPPDGSGRGLGAEPSDRLGWRGWFYLVPANSASSSGFK